MHQSFVTTDTATTGLGNSRDIDFPLCKDRVYVQQCGDISMVKALLKSWQVILKLAWPVRQETKSRAVPHYCGNDADVKTWHLRPAMPPVSRAPLGPGLQMTSA